MQCLYSTNKRIIKNTLMLYIRMGILILVNLYTSRVILNALGAEDLPLSGHDRNVSFILARYLSTVSGYSTSRLC